MDFKLSRLTRFRKDILMDDYCPDKGILSWRNKLSAIWYVPSTDGGRLTKMYLCEYLWILLSSFKSMFVPFLKTFNITTWDQKKTQHNVVLIIPESQPTLLGHNHGQARETIYPKQTNNNSRSPNLPLNIHLNKLLFNKCKKVTIIIIITFSAQYTNIFI